MHIRKKKIQGHKKKTSIFIFHFSFFVSSFFYFFIFLFFLLFIFYSFPNPNFMAGALTYYIEIGRGGRTKMAALFSNTTK